MRHAIVLALLALVSSVGCFEKPRAKCTFVCGPGGECPSDYQCGSDNRCHLVSETGALEMCDPEVDASVADAATADAAADAAPDAAPDARPDAGPDAGPDAAPPDAPLPATHGGAITVLDVEVVGLPGHGGSVSVDFTKNGDTPVLDDRNVIGLGCVAHLYDLTKAGPAPGLDEGTVILTGTTAEIPPCKFVDAQTGYLCTGASGQGKTGDAVAAGPNSGEAALEIAAETKFGLKDEGRFVRISGATSTANNGEFPIVKYDDTGKRILYVNPAFVAEEFTGSYAVAAGRGVIPSATPPDFLLGVDKLKAELVAGGGGHFESFVSSEIKADKIGFSFTAETQTAMTSMPLDGKAVTIECDKAGNKCGSAQATALTLTTTDADVSTTSPFAMPTPTGKLAIVTCSALGSSITIPDKFMKFIMDANPTRVRALYLRVNAVLPIKNKNGAPNGTSVAVGRGIIGFTTKK
jgi:hypothetical protein